MQVHSLLFAIEYLELVHGGDIWGLNLIYRYNLCSFHRRCACLQEEKITVINAINISL